ncbi:DELLA protein RGL2 [Linum grandiflorum]
MDLASSKSTIIHSRDFNDVDDDQWLQLQFSPSFPAVLDHHHHEIDGGYSNSNSNSSQRRSNFDLLHKYGFQPVTEEEEERPVAALIQQLEEKEEERNHPPAPSPPLSAEEVVRIAGTRIVQHSSRKAGSPSMLQIPFDPSLSYLSHQDLKNVELAEYLLAAAERVGDKQFHHAAALLNLCDAMSSETGNPVQRLGHVFSKALRDRISLDMGRAQETDHNKPISPPPHDPHDSIITTTEFAIRGMERGEMPLFQVPHLVGVQAILENVATSSRIHVIDLRIRTGQHWVALIQGLVSRRSDPTNPQPVELLRVTAVYTASSDESSSSSIEETGNRLSEFAKSMNIPFRFDIVVMEDNGWTGFNPDRFGLNRNEESLVVYSEWGLRRLLTKPRDAERVMKTLKQMNTRVMITVEVEANLNSPNFSGRFVEALFHFSAVFENIECCNPNRDDPNRVMIETVYLGDQISNILATEGEARYMRSVKIDVWRRFFKQFGMEEIEPSAAALHQAKLFMEKYVSGQPYTIGMDGKSMVLGFKTTPMICVSTWKFVQLARLASTKRDLRVEFY